MRDIVGQSLGAMSPGPRLNQSGVDHVSQGLSSPLHDFMVQSSLRNNMLNQWNVRNKSIDDGNISLSNITDLTLEETLEEGSSRILILVLSLILAGLIVASFVFLSFYLRKTFRHSQPTFLRNQECILKGYGPDFGPNCFSVFNVYNASLGPARRHSDEPENQPGLWNEDDVTLYSTIFLDDANLGGVQNNLVVDNTLSGRKSQSEYSRLKRNYGNRINSEENESENPYDKVVVNTQAKNRLAVFSQSSDDYTPHCTTSSTVYVVSEFPEVF